MTRHGGFAVDVNTFLSPSSKKRVWFETSIHDAHLLHPCDCDVTWIESVVPVRFKTIALEVLKLFGNAVSRMFKNTLIGIQRREGWRELDWSFLQHNPAIGKMQELKPSCRCCVGLEIVRFVMPSSKGSTNSLQNAPPFGVTGSFVDWHLNPWVNIAVPCKWGVDKLPVFLVEEVS